GLAEPVRGLGRRLGVPPENIRAVELEYNELSGDWWRYYEPGARHKQTYLDYGEGPLTVSSGKPSIVQELADGKYGRRMMIGDGASDLATREIVDLFVGFGGVVARQKVRDEADVFVSSNSLAATLPLAAGASGYAKVVGTPHQAVFDLGLALAEEHVAIKSPEMAEAFKEAFRDIPTFGNP